MKKLIVGLAAVATLLLVAAPPAHATAADYASVTNEGGVIRVSSWLPGQPLFGASVDTNTGEVCVGFSLQRPLCAQVPVVVQTAAAPAIVTVDSDASDGSVGVATAVGGQPLLGVRYSTSGRLCAGFSYQVPVCIELGSS